MFLKSFSFALLTVVFLCTQSSAVVYVASIGDNSTGNSWSEAFTSIQTAIDQAAAASPTQDVWVAEGDYLLSLPLVMKDGVAVYGGFPTTGAAGLLDRDPKINVTKLDGQGATYPVVRIDGVSNVRLDGFTVTGGYGANPDSNGAGVLCNNATPVNIANCRIHANRAPGAPSSGAGVMCMYSDVRIEDCDVSDNTVSNNSGGISGYHASVTIASTTVRNNTYGESGGGCGFWYCTVAIQDSEISNNSGGANGGGVFCHSCPAASFERTRFADNAASAIGGGITTYDTPLAMTNCVVTGNIAAKGGGIEAHGSGSQYIRLAACLVANNQAYDIGGGLFTGVSNCDTTVAYCTIAHNGAGTAGGGVYVNDSTTTITDSILAGNAKVAVYEGDLNHDAIVQYCLFFNNPDGHYYDRDTDRTFMDIAGASGLDLNVSEAVGNIEADPSFFDPEAGDYHLKYDSPCIDAVSATAPTPDIDGHPRPYDVRNHGGSGQNAFDIGCYEFVVNPFDDSDGDGVTNDQEATWGTDPLNPQQWPNLPTGGFVALAVAALLILAHAQFRLSKPRRRKHFITSL